jgi:hypothetical protein
MAATVARFGILHYDVPTDHKKQFAAYAAIRKVIRGKSVMLSRSCYLIPIGLRTALDREMEQVEKEGKFGLRWGIVKFDPSENKKTQREVVLALQRMITGALASYKRSCAKVRALLNEGETTIEALADRTYSASRAAMRLLDEATTAAAAFEELGSVEDIFKATAKALDAEVKAEGAWEKKRGVTPAKRREPKDEEVEAAV